MQTKTLSMYLAPLQKHQEIVNTLADITSSDSSIECIRGTLLRTLNEQKKPQIPPIHTNIISSFLYHFFKPQEIPSELVNDLIHILQDLARDFPLEDVDPIDREPIGDAPYFLSLTGRKYKLSTLSQWIQLNGNFILPDRTPMYPPEIEKLKELCKEFKFFLTKTPTLSTLPLDLTVKSMHPDLLEQIHSSHITTIKMLEEQGLNWEDIVQEIRGLHFYQSEALFELFTKGLRGEHLRKLDPQEFGPYHVSVLKMMVHEWDYSIEEAVHSISGHDFESVQNFYAMPNPKDRKI